MQTTTRVLNVFLASPDDVKDERIVAEEIVNDVDKFIGSNIGWNIRLYKWEDTPPAAGRPQEIINAAVDNCDLFIGLLWERWGQPSGQYSSGFEEEFERARSRYKKTQQPEIWLVFKEVDKRKQKDAGPQLSRVLEFKEKQTNQREFFYGETENTSEWRRKLRNWLDAYILKLHTAATKSPQQPATAPETVALAVAATESVSPDAQARVPRQLLDMTECLTKTVKSGELEFSPESAKTMQEFDVARLFLLSSTWMSRRYTGSTLGTHEVNLLFKHRRELKTTSFEALQLFRALLVDRADVVPGWFWFSLKSNTLKNWLLLVCDSDLAEDVRGGALRLLRGAKIILPKRVWPMLPLTDKDQSVRSAAFDYLGFVGDNDIRRRLEVMEFGEDSLTAYAARDAALSISLRTRPVETAQELLESTEYASDKRLADIEPLMPKVTEQALLKGVENQWVSIRRMSATELARRGRLSEKLAHMLIKDGSVGIREIGFRELARQGVRPNPEEVRKVLSEDTTGQSHSLRGLLGGTTEHRRDEQEIMRMFFKGQPLELAVSALDWFEVESTSAYKSIAIDRFESSAEEIRADLDTDFMRIRQHSIEKLKQSIGPEAAEQIIQRFSKLDNFIQSQYVEAALTALANHGAPDDIRFGRQYLTSTYQSVKLAAVRIVCRFGTAEDYEKLLDMAKTDWGEVRDEAGIGALRLSPTRFETARELTQSQSEPVVRAAFDWLYAQPSKAAKEFFEKLLSSESDKDRVRAVYYFSKHLSKTRLESMLKGQLKQERYYYNVVTWFDRLLYAPRGLRKFFAEGLARQATGQS